MAIFSTNYAAETTTADQSIDDLGVDLSLSTIPNDIKNLLIKVAGDIPTGQQGDSTRPRYALLKGKVAAYAGFYLDGSNPAVLRYDATTDSGNDPFYIASATFTVTAAGVNKNKITLNVKIKTTTKSIAEYKVKTNDTTDLVAQGLINHLNLSIRTHGFYASVSGSVITIRATSDVGGSASDLTLSFTQTGTANGAITTQFATSTSTTAQTNRSIDKLTFYIMFKAPFKNATYNQFYGDPLVQATNSWSYAANEMRAAHNLKRLNSAGEQVQKFGTEWKNVNDAGEDLDKYTNQKGYEFLGIDVKDAVYLSDSKLSLTTKYNLDTPATERVNLFKHVDATQPKDGYNKIPPYFFIVAARQENPYNDICWLAKQTRGSYSRGVHFPANINTSYKNRKYIRFTTALGTVNVEGKTIKKEPGTGNLYVEVNNIKYNLLLAAGEQLTSKVDSDPASTTDDYTYESLSLEGATIVKKDNRYLAEFDSIVDATILGNNSGITVGMGLDLGNAFNGLYRIEFTIAVNTAATGHFRLYYWDNVSDELPYSITAIQLKNAINDILFSDHLSSLSSDQEDAIKELVTVTSPPNQGGIKTYTVKIERKLQAAYFHPVYSATDDLSQVNSNVTFNPAADKDRWEVVTDVLKDGWHSVEKTMNYSFSNQPNTNGVYDKDFWLKQNGISATDQNVIKNILKFSMGASRGRGYAVYINNRDLVQKVEFKSYTQSLRGIYNEIFIPRYYNARRQSEDGKSYSNGTTIESKVIQGLTGIHTPNQAELHLMASAVYNSPGTLSGNAGSFKSAIKSHSLKALSQLVPALRKERQASSYEFIYSLPMIKNIYRGVID
ncbi:hypothetical protein [Dawidia soli]|uniref:Uncharacterized protein n=1 Tax=Dawidia soli TaxID=2782352 RepID=A0AAP2DD40_9BACT|nr:hypothetical protein [Dawidia soli]MBT1689819.1 hypothetical protein [Dawidia soli]